MTLTAKRIAAAVTGVGLVLESEGEHHHVAGAPLQRPREQLEADGGNPVAGLREHDKAAPGKAQQSGECDRAGPDAQVARALSEAQQGGSPEHEQSHECGYGEYALECRGIPV